MIDNTIIPSYFQTETRGASKSLDNMTNLALRVGEIKAIFYPDNPKNISRKLVEYTVEVVQQDNHSTVSSTLYHGCIVSHLFGGVADTINYTLRPAEKQDESKGKTVGVGSKVLLICINGNKTNAVIIGGLPDLENSIDDKKSNGHNLFFEFNGAQATVNKDGELQVRYRGATKVDGTLTDSADANAEGSTIIFTKEGGIKVYTKDAQQFLHLDHKNKKIDILADSEWHVKINDKLAFEAGGTINIKGGSTCTLEMTDKVFINSAGVYVGAATDSWMLGSTYRTAEGVLNTTLSGLLTSLTALVATAATSLNVASALHKIPIAGPIVGSVPLQVAAVALTAAAPIFAAMGTAITAFESAAPTYLSLKNRND